MSNRAGIYEILNTANGKRYIGSAARFTKRFAVHRHGLRRGAHHSAKLQRAWNKYGEAAFVFREVLVCSLENLIEYEQRCIDAFHPEYNIALIAGSCLGIMVSDSARAKMSAAKKGKPLSDAHRANIGAAHKGKIVSAETKRKMSIASLGNTKLLGKKLTLEHRANISKGNLGKVLSEDTRRKLSAAMTGKVRGPHSPEHRAKISAANTGKTWPAETRAKLTGRVCSEETRDKISATKRKRLTKKEDVC